MRIYASLAVPAMVIAAAVFIPQPATAERVCRQECIGPVCQERCFEAERRDDRRDGREERREERRDGREERGDDRRDGRQERREREGREFRREERREMEERREREDRRERGPGIELRIPGGST
jgi:hypothetical protein